MFEPQHIIDRILEAADPANAVRRRWPPTLSDAERITIVAAGKAAHTMTEAALDLCGSQVVGGAAATLPDYANRLRAPFATYPAAHPFPDGRNLKASRAIVRAARPLGEADTLLLLLSGGGSAMMAYPAGAITLGDLYAVIRGLMHAGASIDELNAVRKHCEVLKGGGLAALAYPARVVALILSDVVGDRLDVIASGPVTADPTTAADALDVLRRYDFLERSPGVTAHLQAAIADGSRWATLKPGDPRLARVETHIVGSNADALNAARMALTAQGCEVVHIAHEVTGEARHVGLRLAEVVRGLQAEQAVIFGGETTVTVRGDGSGGRNQEMALAAALSLEGVQGARVMTFATDGIDGPTDAAGALVDGETATALREAGINPEEALANNDSHTALDAAGALLRTGATGTNVNDVAIGLRLPPS